MKSTKATNGLICLDADGVLLDYTSAYGKAWMRAFGSQPTVANPNAYWPWDYWGIGRLSGESLSHFRSCMDENFWATIPIIVGAKEACEQLRAAGFDLLCVSALEAKFQPARVKNLRDIGIQMPVIATGREGNGELNSKAAVLNELEVSPVAFVDDYPFQRYVCCISPIGRSRWAAEKLIATLQKQ
jgi:phosphoglycolate phosphatase-like HAD superfamily hydrolase